MVVTVRIVMDMHDPVGIDSAVLAVLAGVAFGSETHDMAVEFSTGMLPTGGEWQSCCAKYSFGEQRSVMYWQLWRAVPSRVVF